MSVRGRLRVFFVFIVVIPMAAVTLLLLRISGEVGEGRVQAELQQAARTATALHEREAARLEDEALRLAESLEERRAWRMPPKGLARLVARGIAAGRYRSAALLGRGDRVLRRLGPGGGLHSALIRFRASKARGPVRAVALSDEAAQDFVSRVAYLTGAEAILLEEGRVVATTDQILRPRQRQQVAGVSWYGQQVRLGGGLGLYLLRAQPPLSALSSQPVLTAACVLLLLVSGAFAWLLSRNVHTQIAAMLAAAKRIGAGDFTARVPAAGRDELAGLAGEFNRMAELVQKQFERIASQENQLRLSIRRLGEAMASGTDREGLLQLALLMTCEACGAEYGRLRPEREPELEVAEAQIGEDEASPLDREGQALLRELEELAAAQPRRAHRGKWHALAARLRHEGSRGAMVLLRRDRPFGDTELEIFGYLTSQIAVSLENLRLYRRLEREAITDDLTGLANRRRFDQLLEAEVARARRFAHPLSLLLMDIDDFKSINDTHGHQAGDSALRRLGRALREETRVVDEPARYGGEEFAVLLPETRLDEAVAIAERVRRRCEASRRRPRFTVSVGCAELGEEGAAKLLARADAALYRAKREGKNRVCTAESEETDAKEAAAQLGGDGPGEPSPEGERAPRRRRLGAGAGARGTGAGRQGVEQRPVAPGRGPVPQRGPRAGSAAIAL